MRRFVLLLGLFLVVLIGAEPALFAQQDESFFFVQLADPQFGFFTNDQSFAQDTLNFEFVVASLNRLKPAFVVICGDLVNTKGDAAQIAEFKRIAAELDPAIRLYNVAGNHDVGDSPTQEELASYREHFGSDYYSFHYGDLYGIVLDSNLIKAPDNAPAEAEEQEAWLADELAKAKEAGARHTVVFQHHSYFLEDAGEADGYFNIPMEPRRRYLRLLQDAGVSHVFAGHLHRNSFGTVGDLEMVTTAPVGRPLGDDPSGMRVVIVRPDGIEHRYYGLGSIPNTINPAPAE